MELITKKTGILFLTLLYPTEEEKPIGIWGQRHLRYIKEHKRLFYVNLLTSGKLNSYLADINEQAEELFFRLVKQLAEKEGVTEELKRTDQMAWVGVMNNIRANSKRDRLYRHNLRMITLRKRYGDAHAASFLSAQQNFSQICGIIVSCLRDK